jgi:hypothetical protein
MNGFFDHLVGRTLGQTASIQPRLPSLFEPDTTATQPDSSGLQIPANPAGASENLPPALVPALLIVPRDNKEISRQSRGGELAIRRDAQPGDFASTAAPQKRDASSSRNAAHRVEDSFPSAGGRAAQNESKSGVAVSNKTPPVENVSIAGQTTPSPSGARMHLPESIRLSTNGVPNQAVPAPLLKPLTLPGNEINSNSSPPPAVHVTIGRVEVRAVLPFRQPRMASSGPSPKVSLDSYLKQRNGGGSE